MSAAIEHEVIARSVGIVMKDLVARATQPLIDRIVVLEKRLNDVVFERGEPGKQGEPGRDGVNGKDADESRIIAKLTESFEDRFESFARSIPVPKNGIDGKDGKDAEVHARDIMAAVIEYMEAHPTKDGRDGRDGKDGRDGVNGINGKDANALAAADIDAAVEEYLERHPPAPGIDGKSVAVDDVLPAVMEKVQKALEAIPVPKDGVDGKDGRDGVDGKSVDPEEVLPALEARLQKAIESLPIPRDGVDGKDGESVTVEQIKAVIESYSAGWALDFEKRAGEILQRAVDRMPKAKDGRDALSLENFEISLAEDLRTLKLALVCGETRVERSVKLPVPIYREIWKAEDQYEIGDCVTYDGSMWVAIKDSKNSRPGEYNKLWRLSVKRGRNGKDNK